MLIQCSCYLTLSKNVEHDMQRNRRMIRPGHSDLHRPPFRLRHGANYEARAGTLRHACTTQPRMAHLQRAENAGRYYHDHFTSRTAAQNAGALSRYGVPHLWDSTCCLKLLNAHAVPHTFVAADIVASLDISTLAARRASVSIPLFFTAVQLD